MKRNVRKNIYERIIKMCLTPPKDDEAIVLDIYEKQKNGSKVKIAQLVGTKHYNLLEGIVREGVKICPLDRVYIGQGKREKIQSILGKISYSKLTDVAKKRLREYITKNNTIEEYIFKRYSLSKIGIKLKGTSRSKGNTFNLILSDPLPPEIKQKIQKEASEIYNENVRIKSSIDRILLQGIYKGKYVQH